MTQYFRLLHWLRCRTARARGVTLGANVAIAPDVDFNLGGQFKWSWRSNSRTGSIELGPETWIERGAVLWAFGGSIKTAPRVFIGPYVTIYGHGGVEIGEWSLISMHAVILSSNHTIPAMDRCMRWEPDILLPTRVGRDVWIGANAVILGGVTIGDGAVIGAGSVVTKNVVAGAIVAGSPARVVRTREGLAASTSA